MADDQLPVKLDVIVLGPTNFTIEETSVWIALDNKG